MICQKDSGNNKGKRKRQRNMTSKGNPQDQYTSLILIMSG